MCKYCDCINLKIVNINSVGERILIAKSPLSWGCFGRCYIGIYNKRFHIVFLDEREFLSDEEITTCPYCGHRLVLTEEQTELMNSERLYNNIFDYIRTLEDGSDKWRYAIDYAAKYSDTKTVDEMIKHIKKHTEKW